MNDFLNYLEVVIYKAGYHSVQWTSSLGSPIQNLPQTILAIQSCRTHLDASQNIHTFILVDVKRVLNITVSDWKKCVRHVVDCSRERIVINVEDSDGERRGGGKLLNLR